MDRFAVRNHMMCLSSLYLCIVVSFVSLTPPHVKDFNRVRVELTGNDLSVEEQRLPSSTGKDGMTKTVLRIWRSTESSPRDVEFTSQFGSITACPIGDETKARRICTPVSLSTSREMGAIVMTISM
ncbi:hypothetical protein EDB87DRAFT_805129 [Lactarius vividus]|nr:hypothetical protein EDB87DRAFT_805129 [Lactarius vividus]